MNDRQSAEELRDKALRAVEQLSETLVLARDRCSEAEYERIKKGLGFAIGKVQTEVLEVIYLQYPELNH